MTDGSCHRTRSVRSLLLLQFFLIFLFILPLFFSILLVQLGILSQPLSSSATLLCVLLPERHCAPRLWGCSSAPIRPWPCLISAHFPGHSSSGVKLLHQRHWKNNKNKISISLSLFQSADYYVQAHGMQKLELVRPLMPRKKHGTIRLLLGFPQTSISAEPFKKSHSLSRVSAVY